MIDCKPVDTPMDPNVKVLQNQGEPYPDPDRYRRLVGKLNYLAKDVFLDEDLGCCFPQEYGA
ncbi:hypothetical protein A2U01_0090946, partial [Trifolium medium]|nr:hypothetical protein [Trifolium medium]